MTTFVTAADMTSSKLTGIRLPSDSMIVHIPMDVTADLGVAMKRVRARRIAKYKKLLSDLLQDQDAPQDVQSVKSDAEHDDDNKMTANHNESNLDTIGSEVRREQFSSMVDYLEAKYARGIMIHDLDERIREKKKQNKGGDDLSVLSDSQAGSCYSEDSGNFIDDSDLRTDIAHQILASSAFGTTKIEAEAAKAKGSDADSICADDHAFFVNVGDLEMEDGWNYDLEEDHDWMNSTARSKGKKRKRMSKENSVKKSSPVKEKKSKGQDKDKMSADKKHDKTHPVEKKKKKKTEDATKKAVSSKDKEEDKGSSPVDEVDKEEGASSVVVKSENAALIEAARKEASNLKRRVDRLYKKCVEEIEKLTKEHLPRKIKGGGTSKCQVVVPEGKASGDELQIGNPHIPGQKLKVKIPKNKVPGDKFTVAVPLPEVESSSTAENKLSKECIDALDKYSMTFDDWCQAEAKYRSVAPKKKGLEKFKVGVERLKKFDKLVTAFPTNLEVPIDPSYLRLLVRRKRQSQSKRKSVGSVSSVTKPTKEDKTTMKLQLPYLGQIFPTVTYNKADFVSTSLNNLKE